MASDCEVIEHVRTQMPYALVSASIAFVLFVLFSLL
jgi:Na+/H+ antiporter NhaC